MKICNECMQNIFKDGLCFCNGGNISAKRIVFVNDCINIVNGIRCKNQRNNRLFVCKNCVITDIVYYDKIYKVC